MPTEELAMVNKLPVLLITIIVTIDYCTVQISMSAALLMETVYKFVIKSFPLLILHILISEAKLLSHLVKINTTYAHHWIFSHQQCHP